MYVYIRAMIIIRMLEPATASIAVYLLAKTPTNINNPKYRKLLLRKPIYLKSKVCKWLNENKNELIDTAIDETNDVLIDVINQIYIFKYVNPSIFLCLYIFILIITILL